MRVPPVTIKLQDSDAFEQFRSIVACNDVDDSQLEAVWNQVKSGGWGEIDARTGNAPSSYSESISTGIARGFNADATPPYRPAPLKPGEIAVKWEHKPASQ
jgi:hypothetical protein